MKKIPYIIMIFATISLNSWEDDPRIEEHNKLTDRLLMLADEQTGAKEYEKKVLEENCQKDIESFLEKTSRWRQSHEEIPIDDLPQPDPTIASNGN